MTYYPNPVEIYHLERIRALLDSPKGYGLRLQYLGIEMSKEEQVAFFSELNYDTTQRLIAHEHRLTEVRDKLDEVLLRTSAIEANLTIRPSSLVGSANLVSEFEAPMSSLNFSTLSMIHRLVMEGIEPGGLTAGRLRAVQVLIGDPGAPVHTPPDPVDVPILLRRFLKWWKETYPTLVASDLSTVAGVLAKLHHGFLSIHPFLDGNGRVGRVLTDQAAGELLGRRVGAELVADAKAYFAALAAADRGDLGPLSRLIEAALT